MTDDFPSVVGVEHRFVEAGGLRMHVAEAGAGEPLLLLHGWPQHWYQWRGVIQRLADIAAGDRARPARLRLDRRAARAGRARRLRHAT